MVESCLVAKLSHYLTLTQSEREFLGNMEKDVAAYERRQVVVGRGEAMRDIYAVKSGWLVAHASDSDGAELIVEIFHPGDVVGVSQLGCVVSKVTYTAATPVELCPFPKQGLKAVFVEHPRLATLFFAFVALERATMIDRLRSMGRMSARNGVALFLLQTSARLRIVSKADDNDSFEMPLSQELIGNALGLSTVSVNRAIRLLETQGHLKRDGRRMELPLRDRLAKELDFVDGDYRLDDSWLPDAR